VSRPLDPRLLARLGGARRSVALGVALGLIATGCVAAQALLLARLLAGAMQARRMPSHLVLSLAALAALAALRAATVLARELAGRSAAERVKAALRAGLLLSAVGRRARRDAAGGAAAGPGAGTLATLAGPGVEALDVYVARCLPDLVLGAAAPLALVVAVGLLDWPSAVVVLVVLGLFPLFGALVGRSSGALAGRRLADVHALGERLVDVFSGLPVLRSFGRSWEQRQVLAAANEALRRSSLAALRVAFLSALVLDTLASLSTALVAVPLGIRLVDGSMPLAPALATLILAPEVFLPVRRASAEFHESAAGLAAAGEVLDVVDSGGGSAEGDGAVAGGPVAGSDGPASRAGPCAAADRAFPIRLRGVTVRMSGSAAPLFEDLDLGLGAGERVAVIGPSGSGKSTLLAVALGFVRPSGGEVLASGVPLDALGDEAWRAWLDAIAYLPERPTLLAGTLGANLRLAAPGASDAACAEALARAGGAGLIEVLGGLEVPIGDGGRPLSAGERQRVGLARVLLRRASLYLLDEPTAHLDEDSEARAVAALDVAIGRSAAILVTHRPAVLALADRVVRLGAELPGGPSVLCRAAAEPGALVGAR
jgi:ATP-binding cassette subfamily C protein CydD